MPRQETQYFTKQFGPVTCPLFRQLMVYLSIIKNIFIFRNRAWMISASMIAVSVDQVLWYIDLIGYILTRKFPVGVAR